MKMCKTWILAVVVMVLMIGCQPEEIDCVRVSGEVETQKRTVADFNKIFFNDVGNLHISQGNETKVLFTAQKSVLEKLDVAVNNEELVVSVGECFNGEGYQLDVFITTPELEKVHMAGVGSLTTDNQIIADDITIILSGVVESFYFDVVADSISTVLSGTGNIEYAGSSSTHRMLLSGVGNIKSYNQSTQSAEISLTGLGDVFIQVSETLKATLNSAGNVFYKGNPEIVKNEYSAGKVVNDN